VRRQALAAAGTRTGRRPEDRCDVRVAADQVVAAVRVAVRDRALECARAAASPSRTGGVPLVVDVECRRSRVVGRIRVLAVIGVPPSQIRRARTAPLRNLLNRESVDRAVIHRH